MPIRLLLRTQSIIRLLHHLPLRVLQLQDRWIYLRTALSKLIGERSEREIWVTEGLDLE